MRAVWFLPIAQRVRSDYGGGGGGGGMSSERNVIRYKLSRNLPSSGSSQLDGVEERALEVIEVTATAARVQAKVLFGHIQLPKAEKLRAEAIHWGCEQLN